MRASIRGLGWIQLLNQTISLLFNRRLGTNRLCKGSHNRWCDPDWLDPYASEFLLPQLLTPATSRMEFSAPQSVYKVCQFFALLLRVAMVLRRLGEKMCASREHASVAISGTHDLVYRKSINVNTRHSQQSNRDGEKRPDSPTVLLWANSRCKVWDVSCPDSLAASYVDWAVQKYSTYLSNEALSFFKEIIEAAIISILDAATEYGSARCLWTWNCSFSACGDDQFHVWIALWEISLNIAIDNS